MATRQIKSNEEETQHTEVDLSESSIYGSEAEDDATEPTLSAGDVATESDIDRLESLTGGADLDDPEDPNADPATYTGKLASQFDALNVTTDEQLDALQVNLLQDDNLPDSRDGSGRIIDDVAEESLAEFTETGPLLDGEGAESVVPGRDDTSSTLRRHHPNTEIGRADAIVEGNLDQPSDETREDSKVDEGTAG